MANVKGKWNMSGRGRDLFPGHQNGKGDKSRVSNDRVYKENYDKINWGHERKSTGSTADAGTTENTGRNCGGDAGAMEKPGCKCDGTCGTEGEGNEVPRASGAALQRGGIDEMAGPPDDFQFPTAGPIAGCPCRSCAEESESGEMSTVPPHQHSGNCESGFAGPRKSCV